MNDARRPIESYQFANGSGDPLGGNTFGVGFAIAWQNGPTRELGSDNPIRNGAFVEEVLMACVDRIEFYQRSRFACEANQFALEYISEALSALNARTAERLTRGVEGKNII